MALSTAEASLRRGRNYFIGNDAVEQIIDAIPENYTVIAPVRDGWAVTLRPIESGAETAFNLSSIEDRGSYRLQEVPEPRRLATAKPMTSAKRFTHRPQEVLYQVVGRGSEMEYMESPPEIVRQAFFGLRPCDVHGMRVMDLTFNRQYNDESYDSRRRDNLVIAQNCFEPTKNCFCTTFQTGPVIEEGFDLSLSALDSGYLVEVGSDAGAKIMAKVEVKAAEKDMIKRRDELADKARSRMKKAFDLRKAIRILRENYDHPYWEQPSERCLSCANCINVCPTCYCYQITDKSSIGLSESVRSRSWDACQNLEFAAVHGGNFRPRRIDRIRQWVNHKLNWTIDQYGRAGCVGCGRCITWCPTRIDITEPIWRLGGSDVGLG